MAEKLEALRRWYTTSSGGVFVRCLLVQIYNIGVAVQLPLRLQLANRLKIGRAHV